MKKIFLFGFGFVLLLTTYPASAQINSNSFLVWNGFKLHWTYNHRLNRMGSYVTNGDSPSIINTAATGLGEDSASFKTYFTKVKAATSSRSVDIDLMIEGKKGQLIQVTREIRLPLPELNPPRMKNIALLNGFDISATDKADKPKHLGIALSEVKYDTTNNQLIVNVDVKAVFECRSIECELFNRQTSYKLHVNLLVLSGYDDITYSVVETQNQYSWNTQNEIPDKVQKANFSGQPNKKYEVAFSAFRSFEFSFDKAHWMVDWDIFTQLKHYNPETALSETEFQLQCREWKASSKTAAWSKQAKFSIPQAGSAQWKAELVLVRLAEGCTEAGFIEGGLTWKGGNRNATSDLSIYKTEISPMTNCPK